jgi:hypothetical protein
MDMRHQRRQTRFSRRVATAWTLTAFQAPHAWENRDRRVMRMSADPADALSSAVLIPETALRNATSWSRSRSRRSREPRSALVTRSAPWFRDESALRASVVRLRQSR